MASFSEDESVSVEESGTRRTRSGRRTNAPIPSTPSRTTRRSKRSEMDHVDDVPAIALENVVEESLGIVEQTPDTYDQSFQPEQQYTDSVEQSLQNDTSSSFPSESNEQQSDMAALYDQSSVTNEPEPQTTDSMDNLLANLAEDNANSLPSGDADNHFAAILNPDEYNQQIIYESSAQNGNGTINDGEVLVYNEIDQMDAVSNESSQTAAFAENLPNGDNSQTTKADVDAEMVSEDELPPPVQEQVEDAEEVSDEELPGPKKVDNAEEVSDEELPGPKLAELPADTEVVSEDELPASNKIKRKVDEGYDPGSPTESSEIPEKKTKQDDDEGVSDSEIKKEEKKTLPDLDKYWKAVNDDPADFTGWTYLLQYVDQENDLEAARAAYDAFLSHYPYCYGYWRKYADYEKRKGNKDICEQVFERGLRAIPLSVDLWIHYLTYIKLSHPDNETLIRDQFESAINSCGLEFRSDKLWEAYIKWETEGKRFHNVVNVYDRLLATPTQGYNGHFDSFQEVVNNNPILSLVSLEEFKRLRTEVRESESTDMDTELEDPTLAPGEVEPDDHVRNEEEVNAVKDKILAARRKIHKATVTAVTARWTFEEGIKRPYFHVKPLERCQLKNWKEYLDFEIEQGDQARVLVLFERCLIACALYDDFWLKLIRFLESKKDPQLLDKTRDAYERACTIHHTDKPSLHMLWASFEECNDNLDKAAKILTEMDATSPNLLQIAYRRINLERRRGDLDRCDQLYKEYIATAKSTNAGSLAIKWARFTYKVKCDISGAIDILKEALERDPSNTRLALQIIDMALHRERVDEDEVVAVIDSFVAREGIELDQKVLFAQRKVEFLEDFGSSAQKLQDAQRVLQSTMSKANEAKKKSELSPSKKTGSKDASHSQSAYTSGQYGQYNSNPSSSYYSNTAAQQYGAQQPYSDGYNYNQQWQQYGSSGFSGYSQWSGYGTSGYY